MVTLTPGSGAPSASTVDPISRPVVVWDHAGADIRTIAANKMAPVCLMAPPRSEVRSIVRFVGFLSLNMRPMSLFCKYF
jgi:hypothetical protein